MWYCGNAVYVLLQFELFTTNVFIHVHAILLLFKIICETMTLLNSSVYFEFYCNIGGEINNTNIEISNDGALFEVEFAILDIFNSLYDQFFFDKSIGKYIS